MEKKPEIDKAYVSPYDKFMRAFDESHEKSASQQAEIQKHQKISQKRDHQTPEAPPEVI